MITLTIKPKISEYFVINIPGNIHAFRRVKHRISILIVRIKQKPDKVGRLLQFYIR